MSPATPDFPVWVENLSLSSSSILYRCILQTNGRLSINQGYIWNGLANGLAPVQLNGGTLRMAAMQFDASAARTDTYISVTGASSVIQMTDCVFLQAPGAGANGLSVGTDNVANNVNGVVWNGWNAVGTNSGLSFDARLAASNSDLSKHISLHPSGYGFDVTSARLNLVAPSTASVACVVGGVEKTAVSNTQMVSSVPLNLGAGVGFGAQTGANNTDLSKHVQLHTSGYGMSVTGGRLNLVAPTAAGVFASVAGTDILIASAGGVTVAPALFINASGPTIRSGTGAATGTQPKGSIWMRTDGAAGSTLYVTQGAGVWAAVAGV
jgi:hypothetical protein